MIETILKPFSYQYRMRGNKLGAVNQGQTFFRSQLYRIKIKFVIYFIRI